MELAERLQAKHHGVMAPISRCEKAGLVARNASHSDTGPVEVRLKIKGERCLELLARALAGVPLALAAGAA